LDKDKEAQILPIEEYIEKEYTAEEAVTEVEEIINEYLNKLEVTEELNVIDLLEDIIEMLKEKEEEKEEEIKNIGTAQNVGQYIEES